MARNWAAVDASQAAGWIDTLPPGGLKDRALSSFVGGISESDPAAGVQWAQRISDPKLRDEALAQSVRSWMQTDPLGAGGWLNSSAVPQGLKERARNLKTKD